MIFKTTDNRPWYKQIVSGFIVALLLLITVVLLFMIVMALYEIGVVVTFAIIFFIWALFSILEWSIN
jgi:hypothetical protein